MKQFHIAKFDTKLCAKALDGATLFNATLSENLRECGLPLKGHSLELLLANPRKAVEWFAHPDSVVISSIGPYAYFYAHIREQLGLDFPIVRDILGGLWTGYLMQEWLYAPFVRPNDVMVFPSDFCRALFLTEFPHLRRANTSVWHPMFCDGFPPWRPRTRPKDRIRIGYIGRLSRDKNVDDVVKTAAMLQSQVSDGRTVELHILGGYYDLPVERLQQIWREQGRAIEDFHYWGAMQPQEAVDRFYRNLDVLLFLSTSNVEALGRVVIEARRYNIPVCMADHAAARELLHETNLVPVDHNEGQAYLCHNGVRTGNIDHRAAVQVLQRIVDAPQDRYRMKEERFQFSPFADYLLGKTADGDCPLQDVEEALAAWPAFSLEMPEPLPLDRASGLAARLLKHVNVWLGARQDSELLDELLAASGDPDRTRRFVAAMDEGRVNYADLSAFPYHLAQLAGFNPRCVIKPKARAAAA